MISPNTENSQHNKYQDNKVKFVFKPLSEDKINNAFTILNHAFVNQNKMWKKFKVPRQQVYKIMCMRLQRCLKSRLNVMMVNPENNDLVMIWICLDVVDHINKPQKIPFLFDWQNAITDAAEEMEMNYFSRMNYKRGQYIYIDVTSTNQKYLNHNLNYQFWLTAFHYYRKLGYKGIFGRTANNRSIDAAIKLGGKIVGEKVLKFKDSTDQFLQFIRLDFDDLKFYKARI